MAVPRHRAAVLLFGFTSGATRLMLGALWTRILCEVFGNSVFAAATVLTAFLLELALGAVVLGRVADRSQRPLVLCGCLEIGIGLYALVFPLTVAGAAGFYGWFYRVAEPGFASLTAVRLGLSLLLMLPTFLMGGTLPLLGRFLSVGQARSGQEVGRLYGAYHFGAAGVCLPSGFLALEALGVRGTLAAAGCTAIGVGLLGIGLGWIAAVPEEERDETSQAGNRRAETWEAVGGTKSHLALITFCIAGSCALAYGVLSTRVLLFTLTASVYSLATIGAVFLAGIALGSYLSARLLVPRLRRPLLWFGVLEVLVGLSVIVSVPLLARLASIDTWLLPFFAWGAPWQSVLTRFADALVVLLAPTLLMGAAFPIVATACLRGEVDVGRRVGLVYAAQMIGAILGLLLAGFSLLPVLGTPHGLLTVAVLNLAVAVTVITTVGAWPAGVQAAVALPAAAVAGTVFLVTPSNVFYGTINTHHDPNRITFIEEHSTGTVSVHDLPGGERLLAVDGALLAGRGLTSRTAEKLQGYIPLFLHPDPKRVVQIGFGSGETARVGLELGIEDYTVIEVCPAVFDAGKHFEPINHGSYHDPRIRKIIMDGKSFARLSDEEFDVVISGPVYPISSRGAALFTVDHFRNCRQRLREGGLCLCRVPLDLRPAEFCMILGGFQEVFPHSSVWVASNCLNRHGLVLGGLTPLRVDLRRLADMMRRPEVAEDLAAIDINGVYDLLDCHVCDGDAAGRMIEEVEERAGHGPVRNTDDHPRLEFRVATRPPSKVHLKENLSLLVKHHAPITPYVVNFDDEARDRAELTRRSEATRYIFSAQVWQLLDRPRMRRRGFEMARKANAAEVHVRSCEAELAREIRRLQRAVGAMPARDALAGRLAHKLFIALRFPEAAEIYQRLVRLETPPSPSAFVNLAEIRFDEGKTAEAEGLLRNCLDRWPDWAEAHVRLGSICFRMRRFNAARYHVGQALRIAPDNPLYQKEYARVAAMR